MGDYSGPEKFGAQSKNPRIAIIGGGVAGLRAAKRLLDRFQADVSTSSPEPFITILEGRSRLGGRLTQDFLPRTKHLVDLGPNWIHGTDHNPILDLAEELTETTYSFGDEGDGAIWNEDGVIVDKEEGKEVVEGMWGVIVQAFKYSNENLASNGVDERKSLYDYFGEKVLEMWEEDSPDTRERKRRMCLQVARTWGAFVGEAVERQSLKYFWLEECLDGENLFLASTYQKILSWIINQVHGQPGCEIKLNTTVTKINYPLKPKSNTDSPQILLETSSRELLPFDEVIITTPLGWLKQNHESAFSPALPPKLIKSIEEVGYGSLEKVFLSFPAAFWDDDDDSSIPDSGRAHAFTHFLSPSYAPSTNPDRHNIESISLSQLPGAHAHPTLLFYVFGSHARQISQSLAALSTAPEKEAFLAAHFQPYFSKLPGYAPGAPQCTPASAFFTNWVADPLAGHGSYCNFQVAGAAAAAEEEGAARCAQDLDGSVRTMREGMPERGVWFAGEHTAPFVALGTVTGAWWSGEAVAGRVAAKYGLGAVGSGMDGVDGAEGVPDGDGEGLRRASHQERNVVGKEVDARASGDESLDGVGSSTA